MKRLIAAVLLAGLSYSVTAVDWYAPQEPFAVFGNTYYVGTGGLSSVLITSNEGHILIDGAGPEAPQAIANHIRQLGFKLADIKFILNSHEHFDHAGGIAALQQMTGATVLASADAEPVLRTGRTSPGDPQFANLTTPLAAVANTRVVRDGEVVKVGPLAVTARYTPGHTAGGTSWTWRSTEGERTASLVYADSLNAITDGKFRYTGTPLLAAMKTSIATVAAFDCDILISAHPEGSDLWQRLARSAKEGNAAFIDRDACRRYAAKGQQRLDQTLATEAAKK
jgi:metallo-beta-lactamase class B